VRCARRQPPIPCHPSHCQGKAFAPWGERSASQQLNATIVQGKDAAIRIRSLARSKLGHKNERLVQFRVAPTRPRRDRWPSAPVDIGLPPAEE